MGSAGSTSVYFTILIGMTHILYYGLNDCVFENSYVRVIMYSLMVLEEVAFRRCLGHEDGTLVNITRDSTEHPGSFHPVGMPKSSVLKRSLSSVVSTLLSDIQHPRQGAVCTCWIFSPSVCDILL